MCSDGEPSSPLAAALAPLQQQLSQQAARLASLEREASRAEAAAREAIGRVWSDVGDRVLHATHAALTRRVAALEAQREAEAREREGEGQAREREGEAREKEREVARAAVADVRRAVEAVVQELKAQAASAEERAGMAARLERTLASQDSRCEAMARQIVAMQEELHELKRKQASLTCPPPAPHQDGLEGEVVCRLDAMCCEVAELRETVARGAEKDAVVKLEAQLLLLPTRGEVEAVRASVAQQEARVRSLLSSDWRADGEAVRKAQGDIGRLFRALEDRISVSEAHLLIDQKADSALVDATATSAAASARDLRQRVAALDAALVAATRNANEAINHARNGTQAVVQLQAASDKQWQLTRMTREELAQLGNAVRSLQADVELRLEGEESKPSAPEEAAREYSRHGWSKPSHPEPSRPPKPLGRPRGVCARATKLPALGGSLVAGNDILSESFAVFSKECTRTVAQAHANHIAAAPRLGM
ncbi:hypothetical protein AB1Y20_014830 [Prymnesium parvum]|uniref:Uncharacterized protein n=1 Tax=Prymnesium parvum TaxID=97485 RepID=A0AB34JW25_PRYPA